MVVQDSFPKDKIEAAWSEGWGISHIYYGTSYCVDLIGPANAASWQVTNYGCCLKRGQLLLGNVHPHKS